MSHTVYLNPHHIILSFVINMMYVLKSCVGNIVGLETEAEPAAGRPRAAQEGEI